MILLFNILIHFKNRSVVFRTLKLLDFIKDHLEKILKGGKMSNDLKVLYCSLILLSSWWLVFMNKSLLSSLGVLSNHTSLLYCFMRHLPDCTLGRLLRTPLVAPSSMECVTRDSDRHTRDQNGTWAQSTEGPWGLATTHQQHKSSLVFTAHITSKKVVRFFHVSDRCRQCTWDRSKIFQYSDLLCFPNNGKCWKPTFSE